MLNQAVGITAETNPLLAVIRFGSKPGYDLYASVMSVAISPATPQNQRGFWEVGALVSLFIAAMDGINKIPNLRKRRN